MAEDPETNPEFQPDPSQWEDEIERIESSGQSYIKIDGPGGPSYILSKHPDKVEIGSINIGSGDGVTLQTKGNVEVGELNVGLDTIVTQELGTAMGTAPGATAISAIALGALLVYWLLRLSRRILRSRTGANP